MAFEIHYFHERVYAEVQSWPVDVLADYARLVELLTEHGPSLRLPHSRAFGDGLFELRPRGRSGIGRGVLLFFAGEENSRFACVHKEVAADSRQRIEDGAKTPEGGDA